MRKHLRTLPRFAAVAVLLVIAACGSSSPTTPTSATIASVTIAGTSVAVGSTLQGTVTLAAAAGASGATVGLSSSNAAVATVPASVAINAGATAASFVVTGVGAGSVTITASMGGSSLKSSTLTVSAAPQLAGLTVSPTTVVGGANVAGTVTLTGAAPSGGAVVSLASDGTAVVPASVTVPAGSTTGMFTVLTQVVGSTVTATIRASYGGRSMTATLSLTKPTVATASFGVTGRDITETCAVINGGAALDCMFNGSTSTAPGHITAYDWTWTVAGVVKTQTTSGAVLATPAFGCSMLPAGPLPAVGYFTLTVTLKIHDDAGNVSALATDDGVRLLPQGSCGY